MSSVQHLEPAAAVILWGNVILFFGIVGRYLARRFHQPGVLGELLMGMLVGNVCYFAGMNLIIILRESSAIFEIMRETLANVPLSDAIQSVIPNPYYAHQVMTALKAPAGKDWINLVYVIDVFSRYGVIFLLFMVGLDTPLEELRQTGRQSIQVAVIGVLAPMGLGLLMLQILTPDLAFKSSLFIAATLSATSVGITARVLKDFKKTRTREARTILGAAMMDDILGLVILAIVSGIAIHGAIDFLTVSRTLLLAILFFTCALVFGPWFLRKMIQWLDFVEPWEAKLFTAFFFVMVLSWLATVVQLATIIGAFVAGMIINEGFFEMHDRKHKNLLSIKNLVAPFESVFSPLFFMLIGIQVKLETFLDWHVLLVAAGLIVVAIIGKLLSGLGAAKHDNRLLIGIGMLPRGEVGLIFAAIGKTIGVISDSMFASIVCMVVVTTFCAPIWLKNCYQREGRLEC